MYIYIIYLSIIDYVHMSGFIFIDHRPYTNLASVRPWKWKVDIMVRVYGCKMVPPIYLIFSGDGYVSLHLILMVLFD